MRSYALAPPSTAEVARVLADAAGSIANMLKRAGLGSDDDRDNVDPLARDDPELAALYAAALQGRVATGPRAGQPTTRLGDPALAIDSPLQVSARCATLPGLSLHAGVSVAAEDRAGLERLCKYMARPALATERLQRAGDGRIVYRLRHRWRDGTSHLVFEPQELLARLAALIPPPRARQTRYHGILAPCAGWRDHVVPAVEGPQPREAPEKAGLVAGDLPACSHKPRRLPAAARIAWGDLLRRIFAVDALLCRRCGSRTRIMAAIRSPQSVSAFLTCVGLPARPPPLAPARRELVAESA